MLPQKSVFLCCVKKLVKENTYQRFSMCLINWIKVAELVVLLYPRLTFLSFEIGESLKQALLSFHTNILCSCFVQTVFMNWSFYYLSANFSIISSFAEAFERFLIVVNTSQILILHIRFWSVELITNGVIDFCKFLYL